jgi:hypothetical protein
MQPAEWSVAGFTEEDWRTAVVALPLASQSLLQSLEVLDSYFSLGFTERLAELNGELDTILTESLAAVG